jgi:imidazolonepropionase-like amidohydrolase
VRRAVRRLVAEGADFIKVMASGGGTVGSIKGASAYTVAELRAVVEEAHRLGRRVVAHAIALQATVDALDAGVDALAHCMFLQPDGSVEYRPEVAERIAAAGAWVTPTLDELWAPFCALEHRSQVAELDPEEREMLEAGRQRLETHAQVCRRLIEAGVQLAAGSDAGWKACAFGRFERELQALVTHGGLSPGRALLAGTRDAAAMLGVLDQAGTVEVGKEADLLLVRGDPTQDLSALTNVLAVFQAGVRVR